MTLILGWLVGIVDVAQFLPHGVKTLRSSAEQLYGLSITTWTIATLQGAAWVVYGFACDLLPIALPNLVITPICALVLILRLRAPASAPSDA